MTKEETLKILMTIQAAYPGKFVIQDKQSTLNAWHEFLGEYTYAEVASALHVIIVSDAKGFPPSIGQITNTIASLHEKANGTEINEMDAWNLVSKAIRKSGWHSEEAFEELPEIVQKAVGSAQMLHNWAIDEEFNESVVMSNFQRTFRVVKDRERQMSLMPAELRTAIEQAQGIGIEVKDNVGDI